MVKKIRRRVRRSVTTFRSRHARRTVERRYSGGRRVASWVSLLFPRARARSAGASWADPRRR